jgi:diguanylate cyclase (GGDEF)-like protein/PAS domain S-box-containing protein
MNLNIFQSRSLKTRVTLFTLTIFLLGIWSLAFYASRMLREDMQRLLGEQQSSIVSFIAAEIDHELDDRIEALELIARVIDAPLLDNPAALQKFLAQRFVLHNLFNSGVIAYRADGTVIADVPLSSGRIGVNYMGIDTVAAALQEGKSTIGRPVMDKKLLAPAFGITVPIRGPQGKVIGALAGTTQLGKHSFLDVITENRYGKSGYYLLEEPKGRLIITGTGKNRIMQPLPAPGINSLIDHHIQGYDETGVTVDPAGVEVLASARRVPVAGWFIVAALPTAEAFAPIHAMQQRMLLATLFLTLLAGGLTWWMLRRQLSPMLAAARTLAALSNTSQPLQTLPITSQDEIGELIGGFNRLLNILAQREEALKESEFHLRTVIENEPECIKIIDAQGRLIQMNPAGLAMIEADSLEQVAGHPILDVIAPEYRAAYANLHKRVLAGESMQMKYEVLGLKGGRRWLETHAVPMQDHGKVVHLAVTHDITERMLAEEKLRLAANVFTYTREGIMITTADSTIIDVNDAFSRITSYSRDEVLGRNPRLLNSGRQGKEFYAALWRDLIENGHWYGEVWNRRKNGEVYAVMQTISAVRDAQGNTLQYVALFSDITPLKEHEKQLEHIAHYDALTTLPNRVLLADRLHQTMAQAQRRGQRLAVVYLDLDGFKAINDRYGHEAGDLLLVAVATRMKQALREGDTLARIGGDEFVAVLVDLVDVAASVPMLTRLLAAAAVPVQAGDLVLQVSASLGVTFYPQTEDVDADQLLRQADQAMYQAKLAGKNRYHFFDAEQDRSVRGHHETLERIRLALAEREFVLYYQPKVNMRTGKVIGAEALIRWQHPEKGLLLPALFLPAIEDHPLAVDLGEWVIATALTQMALWQAAGQGIPVSVNVGARQLQQADFVERLGEILVAHPNIKPSDLELEVLETSALEDLAQVSQVIEACREIGVSFAMDDFGTGYSSLTYLKRLPVTLLKIDQSFVRDMLDDPDDLAILEGVIGLATAFRRQVIAEGVETVEHGAMLLQLGCELAQGYGIARPMPAHELPGWSAAWRPDPAWDDQPAVSRDDLALIFASVEHRAWIAAIASYLKGEREVPPPLDHRQCRFGMWLDAEGLARHGAQPAFQAIELLHREVHALAAELCELHAWDRAPEALARLGELHGLRDALLAQLKTLVQENRR